MDPGPWAPYTYNGLSAPGVASASGSLASAAGQRAMADFQAMGSQPGASQLLQLAGMSPAAAVAAAANSASFLSSNYEPVFTSLFHHSAQKSQYGALNVAHHRQPLVKPGDSELTAALRDNYIHQSVATSTAAALYEQTSPLNWSQANTSLGSPFGVLPHESVSGSSKSSSPDKKGHIFSDGSTPPYENTFSAHLSPPFAHGYTNSQLAAAADFRNSSNPTNFDSKKVQKSTSHDSKASASSTPWQGAFSQVTPTSARDCSSLPPPPATSFAPSHAQKVQVAANFVSRAAAVAAASTVAVAAATAHQQQASPQTCIVSRPGHHQVPPNLPFVPQHRPSSVPAPMVQEKTAPRSVGFSSKAAPTSSHVPTKAQSKGFPSGPLDASVNSTVPHESSQSPRFGLDANHNFSSSAAAVASASKAPSIPQAHQRVPYPNPTAAHMAQYRNFPSPDAGGPVSHATEYQRSTPDSIALSPYSDSEPQHCHTQNGGSSSSSGMGRPSPTQNSPLSHTPSPAYPIYNSPMSAPSPHHETPSCVYSKPTPSQQSSGYPSVIQCNSAPSEVKHVTHARQNFPPSIKQSWEMHEKLVRGVRDMSQSNAGPAARFAYATESMDVMDEGMLAGSEGLPQHRQTMYEAASTINMQDLQGPSSEELLARGATEAEVDEYDRRRGRKVKRRKSDEKSKPVQNCGYPTIQNGYFPTAYHENLMARNSLGSYHPRLGFNPAHMHGQPAPAHTQCGSNPPIYHQMGPLPLSMQQQQGPSTSTVSPSQHVPPEKPPLLGPSVEDELAFLEDPAQVVTPQSTSSQVQRPGSSKDSTGFMDSYMKFLRGETETPLTISVRAGRKSPKVADPPRRNSAAARATAARNQVSKAAASPSVASTPPASTADKPCQPYQQQQPHSDESKKQASHQDSVPVMLAAHVRQQPDVASCLLEDKRTPKEACLQPPVLTNPEVRSRFDAKARDEINLQQSRGRPTKRSAPVQEELPEELPKRKTARRKAKQEAALRKQFAELSDDEEPADTDSDSDPVWTPPIDEGNKVVPSPKKSWSRRGRPARFSIPKENSSPKKKPGRRPKTYESDASSRDSNDSNSDTESEIRKTKRPYKRRYPHKDPMPSESTDSEVTSSKDVAAAKKPHIDESRRKRFVSGAFVIPKAEINDECPSIWRIDGKNLIQKYDSFREDGKIYYRNVSTYSGWTDESCNKFEIADIIFIKNNKQETIIHLAKNADSEQSMAIQKKKFMVELEVYLDPFRTYMQTLVSQVLDRSFITVILSENDEYFVNSMTKIDDEVEKKRSRFRNVIQLHGNTEDLINKWPSYSVSQLPESGEKPICATCISSPSSSRLSFIGKGYNPITLSITCRDPSIKEFTVCEMCEPYIDMYSRLVHLKFNYYKLCAVRVEEIKKSQPKIDTGDLLQTVLNPEWIEKVFRGLQEFWSKVELIIYKSMNVSSPEAASPSSE